MADVKFKTIDRGALRIRRELKVAAGKVALVGIPGTADPVLDANGKPAEISMAQLAFIMEKGSDVNKIPARPFMERTRQRCTPDIAKYSRKLYSAVLSGRIGANQALKLLGERYEGENNVQRDLEHGVDDQTGERCRRPDDQRRDDRIRIFLLFLHNSSPRVNMPARLKTFRHNRKYHHDVRNPGHERKSAGDLGCHLL